MRVLLLGVTLAGVFGCEANVSESFDFGGPSDKGTVDTSIPVDMAVIDAGMVDMSVVEPDQVGRSAGRMTIDQLARSIPIITDGIRWTEDFGNGPVDMMTILAPTMGAPDYRNITVENLEPTLIIAKFMRDASNRICTEWVARDQEQAVGERSLVRHAEWDSLDEAEVKATIKALQFRFFARQIPADDDTPIAALYDLFRNASSTAIEGREAADGWTAICIALMTDPEFVLY